MRRIPLSDAQPGQTLAENVCNAQQMLLLKKGRRLTASNLQILKAWGVDAVWITKPETDPEPAIPPGADYRDIEAELIARFGDALADPVMAAICRSAVRIVSERS